jgi:hypothetical protein
LRPGKTRTERKTIGVEYLGCRPAQHGSLYFLPGGQVCRSAFCRLVGISNTTLVAYKNECDAARAKAAERDFLRMEARPNGAAGSAKLTTKTRNTLRLINEQANLLGEVSPKDGNIHVFIFINLVWLWHSIVALARRADLQVLKLRRFMDLFNGASPFASALSHIKWWRGVVAKRCEHCVSLALQRLQLQQQGHGKSSDQWQALTALHQGHVLKIQQERGRYMSLTSMARGLGIACMFTLIAIDAGSPGRHPLKPVDTSAGRKVLQLTFPIISLIYHNAHKTAVFTSPANGVPVFKKGELKGVSWDLVDVELTIIMSFLHALHSVQQLKDHVILQVPFAPLSWWLTGVVCRLMAAQLCAPSLSSCSVGFFSSWAGQSASRSTASSPATHTSTWMQFIQSFGACSRAGPLQVLLVRGPA